MENIHGILSNNIQGQDREEKWSDLWYIFKPNGFDKTLAEMDSFERENRRKTDGSVQALQEFANWYEKQQIINDDIKLYKENSMEDRSQRLNNKI